MRVAQFVHRYPPAVGGAEAYVERLTKYLSACGDNVTVWTTTAVELGEMWNGTQSPPAAAGGLRRYPPITLPLRRYLLKAASLVPIHPWSCLTLPCNPICPDMWRDAGTDSGPVDAVHATAFPYSFPIMCARRLARRKRVPFLLTPFLHLGDPTDPHDRTRRQYAQPCLRWLLTQADRVFVMTPSERDTAMKLGVAADRVVLQGLGVDPAECTDGDREAARRNWGVTNHVVIGHLANNSVEKGTVDLLRATETLGHQGVHFRLVLAGPEMPNFHRAWADFPRPELVTRLGVLTDAQKRDFFAGIDIFALPSRTDSFGLVLLEAWANGKPVVAYRAGGPADLVRDHQDGRLAPCGDIAFLTGALLDLVRSAELRERYGVAGRDRVGVEFGWEDKLRLFRGTARAAVEQMRADRQPGEKT